MTAIRSPAMRYHGGKFRLAPWIIAHMPPHTRYVEPFGGAAGVLLQKPRCYAEIYNDLDGDIVNFFAVLRDPASRAQLLESIALTPYSRDEFTKAWQPTESVIEQARRTAIRAQMGFGSAGATKGITGFRCDSRRTYGTAQHIWAAYPPILQAVGERFAGVLLENREATRVMRDHDGADTLHFVDPPYLHDTRCRGSSHARYYRHEMDDAQHLALLDQLRRLRGMVLLSGYASPLYTDNLQGWTLHQKVARISAGRGTALRTECLWLNPAATSALGESAGLRLEIAA